MAVRNWLCEDLVAGEVLGVTTCGPVVVQASFLKTGCRTGPTLVWSESIVAVLCLQSRAD